MKTRTLAIVILITVLVLTMGGPAMAQGPQLPTEPPFPSGGKGEAGGPQQGPNGLWYMPEGVRQPVEAAGVTPQATGGPDQFGYTWDDSVPFNWIDATDGTDTGLYAYTGCSTTRPSDKVGPIPLPFSFKYYENTYTSLYIAAAGYVGFTDEGVWTAGSDPLPSPSKPNNVIAPYWEPLCVPGRPEQGHIFYESGGTEPNRYFVVEWHDVQDNDNTFRFEVILYENGDIVFQYHTMNYWGIRSCNVAGIENATGLDGLSYLTDCQRASSNKAVRFYRPAASARVRVWPTYQSRFTRAGATESFQVFIRNTGELGTDTYDLTISSAWPVSLYAADGITPLTDTDSDGAVDTGPVAQRDTVTVTVKVQTPNSANVGDHNSAAITVCSSLDTTKTQTASLQTAVPAPFAQVYRDDADGAMSLYLVQPGGQAVKKATLDRHYGYDVAVTEMLDGFAYFWFKDRTVGGNVHAKEIEYTLLDRYGDTVRPVRRLTDHAGATMDTYDYDPAVAVAPNGRIGVLWRRYLGNNGAWQSNENIWFAILDASGNRVYGPVNLTNNTAWGDSWNDLNVPSFYYPRIAATGDNRFVLAWERRHVESAGWIWDAYYAVRDSSGAEVRGITKLTQSHLNGGSHQPGLAPLSGNLVLVALGDEAYGDVYYIVLNSNGEIIRDRTNLVGDYHDQWDGVPDAVQLSDGRIVVAWYTYGEALHPHRRIRFAVLDQLYNRIAGPTTLHNPAAVAGDASVSVAADSAGHAILTWMDSGIMSSRCNLYYALVDGNGNVLTPPMIFRTSQATSPNIETGEGGYGNTSYSWTPPSGVDGVAAFSASLFGGPPGGNAAVGVRYANHGATIATGVVLTATLDSNLTYVGDTSGVIPTVGGNDVAWNLPDLGLLESRDFTLYVQVPAGADYGTRYPITLTLSSAGPEANAGDNTTGAQVMAARQVFLPLVFRNYP